MAIQAISFGNNTQTTPVATEAKPKRQIGTVGKGSLIGAGVGTAIGVGVLATNSFAKEVFKSIPAKAGYIAMAASGYALLGAGIGKLVKNHQENKQMEKEAEERDAKKALDKQA